MAKSSISRRNMLKATAAAVAAPTILAKADPTETPIRVGLIGGGVRGWNLAKYLGATETAQVVAVSDVYAPHVDRAVVAGLNPDAKRYVDYHDLISDPNVEAVVIATPDHWHERMVLDAAHAGKAVYCEKGLTTSVDAAKRMRAAIKKDNTVFQLGHQGRQYPATEEAGRRIREGEIGDVSLIHLGRFENPPEGENFYRWYGYYDWYDRPDPKEVEKNLDWEKWLGDRPDVDFNEEHFWHWRCYWRYGTGMAGDLLSHEMDHLQCTLGWGIPDTCMCAGMNALNKDGREIPDTWLANYTFEEQNCAVTFDGCLNSFRVQPPEYMGKKGRILFGGIGQNCNTFSIYPDEPAFDKRLEPTYTFESRNAPKWPNHMEEFLSAVRTGAPTKCNIDEAFIEGVTIALSVESYKKKREVRWDPAKEEIV